MRKLLFIGILVVVGLSCKKEELIEGDITYPSKWEVMSIKEINEAFSLSPKASYVLEFKNEIACRFITDANSCYGQYGIPDKGEIGFFMGSCALVCCDSEFAEKLQDHVLNATHYTVTGDILTLKGEHQVKLKRIE